MKKRKDECIACTSRSCHNQIYRDEEPKYDEVYCHSHHKEAETHCNETLGVKNGILRTYRNSTAKLRRGDR